MLERLEVRDLKSAGLVPDVLTMPVVARPDLVGPIALAAASPLKSVGVVVNLADYLAAPGVTSVSETFRVALKDAAGGTLLIPPGIYNVAGIPIPADTTILGDGATLRLLPLARGDGRPILDLQGPNIAIRGIVFDGNKDEQSPDGFSDSFDGGGITVTGSDPLGRSYRAAIRADGRIHKISNLDVQGCTFSNTYGAAIAACRVSRVRVVDNTAYHLNFELAFLGQDGTGRTSDVLIADNRIEGIDSGAEGGPNGDAIIVTAPERLTVTSNLSRDVFRDFLKIEQGSAKEASEITVTDNLIENRINGGWQGLQFGDRADGILRDVSVVGNVIRDVGYSGVFVDGSVDGMTISENEIDGTDRFDGVEVTGTQTRRLSVVDNVIQHPHRYGIFITPTTAVADLTVDSNRIDMEGSVAGAGLFIAPDATAGSAPSVSGSIAVVDNIMTRPDGSYFAALIEIDATPERRFDGVLLLGNVLDSGSPSGLAFFLHEDGDNVANSALIENRIRGRIDPGPSWAIGIDNTSL